MSKVTKRKFGVNRINMSMEQGNLICAECGHRAGLHYGNECPTKVVGTGKPLPKNEKMAAWAKEHLND